ncbi:MAG: hypothetical protein HYX78_06325 [Armatimonadetes bacterium]|nr:hypothetical protein [Armatimonadota bacterium]
MKHTSHITRTDPCRRSVTSANGATFLFCALLLIAALVPALSAGSGAPTVIRLGGDWDFYYSPTITWAEGGVQVPALPSEKDYDARMPVPGYWDDNLDRLAYSANWSSATFFIGRPIVFPSGRAPLNENNGLPYLRGIGYYKRIIDAPADWQGKSVTLQVGSARTYAWAWVNGHFIGENTIGYVPFEISCGKWIKPGQSNEVVIAVCNTHKGCGGLPNAGYAGSTAGIYRPVHLKVSGPARIADCYIHAQDTNTKLLWNVEVETEGAAAGLTLDWSIHDTKDGSILGRGNTPVSGNKLTWTTEPFGMKSWSDHDPKLYRIELTLRQGEKILDQFSQPYGLRTLVQDGTSLRINGRPVMLRGECEIHYYPLTCTPPLDVESYRENIRALRKLGFNFIRFHTWVPSEEYMQAADELGMFMQVELPSGLPKKDDDAKREWVQIIRTCRKHPSVVIYCCGNEGLVDEASIEFLRELAARLRENAPDALFSPQSALYSVEYGEGAMGLDKVTEPFTYNPKRLSALKEFSQVFNSYSWGYLSYGSYAGDWKKLDKWMEVYQRPILTHELGIRGNYLDLDLEHRYEGTRLGTDLYAATRKYLQKEGLLDKARTYYVNACNWTRILAKNNVETARKCKYITGWDMLGGHDQHWVRGGYPCGLLMNEFFELKPGLSVEDVLKFHGESVILLDYTNDRNLWAGSACQFDIMSSLYGEGPLKQGSLTWHLSDSNGRIYERGQMPLKNLKNGKIERLGVIKFSAPASPEPLNLTLYARLSGDEYEIVNDWDFWVFPKDAKFAGEAAADETAIKSYGERFKSLRAIAAKPEAALRVVSQLSVADVEYMTTGGRVVLLGATPFPVLATSFSTSTTGRAEGNLATVIADHPLLRGFPHEGWCDWQFYSMLEDGKAVVFNDINMPFEPIVEVVSSFKYIRKQSNLFELAVGRGSLIVCTMNLDLSDPASSYMLDRILRYAESEEFKPKQSVSARLLLSLLGADLGEIEVQETEYAGYGKEKGPK